MPRNKKLEKDRMNNSGNAGKNIIQVGRDYLSYLQFNILSGNWIPILINAIVIGLIFYGLANGAKTILTQVTVETSNQPEREIGDSTDVDDSKSIEVGDSTPIEVDSPTSIDIPNSKPSPTVPNPALSKNLFYSYSFPLESCGDKLPDEPTAYPINFYPVFVQFSEDNLTKVKSFCKDAFKKLRKSKNIYEIQVASFVGIERATKFKGFIKDKIGSGDIGEVTVIEKKTEPAAPANPSQATEKKTEPAAPVSSSKTPQISSVPFAEGFQEVFVDCSKEIAGQFIDLEIESCGYGYGQVKNYSGDWYEQNTRQRKIILIGPGKSRGIVDANLKTRVAKKTILLKRSSLKPSRSVTVRCDDEDLNIWGVRFMPKCTSSGLYIDVEAGSAINGEFLHPIQIVLDNGQIMNLKAQLGGDSGYITSNGRSIPFKIRVK